MVVYVVRLNNIRIMVPRIVRFIACWNSIVKHGIPSAGGWNCAGGLWSLGTINVTLTPARSLAKGLLIGC